jgi:hypothetical protein
VTGRSSEVAKRVVATGLVHQVIVAVGLGSLDYGTDSIPKLGSPVTSAT